MYSASVPNICKIQDCLKVVKGNGFCRLHWDRVKKHGDPNFVLHPYRIDPSVPCEITGCENKVVSKNMCSKHYNRKLKTGSATTPLKKQLHPKGTPCKAEGCAKKIVSFGYCSVHYGRLKKYGDINLFKKIPNYSEDDRCSVDDCSRKPVAKGFCSKHWQMNKVHGDPKGGRYEYKIRKAVTHDDGTRTCSECDLRQPIANFHKDKNATDGFRSKCKKCRLNTVKKWYAENQPRQLERHRKAYERDIEKIRVRDSARYEKDKPKRLELASEHSQLRRARKAKAVRERGISRLALRKLFGDNCYYCGVLMDFTPAKDRKFKKNHASIEHLVPLSKGGNHTWENVVLACHSCNTQKNAKSEEDFKALRKKRNLS